MSEKVKKESVKKLEVKKVKAKKDANKVKKWAQERRQRIGDAFELLHKELPNYDPSIKLSHIEILQQAASRLKELTEKLKKLLVPDAEVKDEKDNLIKKLENRVRKLVVRNEQLCNLLKDANITIPTECGTVKKFKSQYKWSGRISMEQAKIIQKKAMENNKEETTPSKTAKSRKRKLKSTSTSCIAPKHRKASINSGETKKLLKRKKFGKVQTKMVILPQVPSFNRSCFILSNPVVNKTTTVPTVISNTPLLTAPVLPSAIKPPVIARNPNLSNLGPGTLILANGTIVPVIQTPQTIVPTTIISAPLQTNTILVVSTKPVEKTKDTVVTTVANAKPIKKLPMLLRKPCLTTTTQMIKLPIPALSSKYSSYVVSNKNKTAIKDKKKQMSKPSQNKTSENSKQNNESDKPVKTITEGTTSESNNEKMQPNTSNDSSKQDTLKQPALESKNNENDPPTSDNSVKTTEPQQMPPSANNQACHEKPTEIVETITSTPQPVVIATTNNPTSETNDIPKTNEATKGTNKQSSAPSETIEKPSNTTQADLKSLEINLPHSELSNDIFASLNVPNACQNPGSTSPTAAFLLAFPLVSSGVKVTEVIDAENSESQRETPQLLQIGTMDNTKTTQNHTDSLTPSFLNMDNFSFLYEKKSSGGKENFDNNTNIVSRDTNELPVLNFQDGGKNGATGFENFDSNYRQKQNTNTRGKNIENSEQFRSKANSNVNNTYMPALSYENKGKSNENTQKLPQNHQQFNKNMTQHNVEQNMNFDTPKMAHNDIVLPNLDHTLNYQPKTNNEVVKNNQNINYTNKFDHNNVIPSNINQPNIMYQNKCTEKTMDQQMNTYTNKIVHEIVPQTNLSYHKNNNDQSCSFSNNKINHSDNIPQTYQKPANIENGHKSDLHLNQIPQYQSKNNKQMDQHSTYNKNDNNQMNLQNISHINYSNQQKNDQENLNLNLLYQNKSKTNELGQNLNQNYHKKSTDLTTDMSKHNYCNYEQKAPTTYPNTTKNYNDLYINSSSYNYNYPVDSNFNQNYYKNSTKSYYPIAYENNFPKNDSYISGNYHSNTQNKFPGGISPKNKNLAHNKPVNWMTTPDNSFKPDYALTHFTKDDFFGANSFVTTTATTYFNPCGDMTEIKKSLDLQSNSCQKEIEDNHFSWSPTRVPQFLDTAHNLMSSTLPTLVGDLALNNPPYVDQRKSKRKSNYEGQNNFFSVSQLVEPPTKDGVNSQANPKRNNSNRNKSSSSPRSKKKEGSKKSGYNLENFCEKSPRKNTASSYSAEALIGNQQQNEPKKSSNKAIAPSFLTENLLPYFPTAELPQDNGYNQNYQPNAFSHGFPPLPDFGNTHDMLGDNILQNKSRHCGKSQSCSKKTKKKPEETFSNFELPFLPIPVSNVNSPMLPDEIHPHPSFLHPTTTYPCKNPLYGKQGAELAPPPPLLGRLPVAGGRSGGQEVIVTASGSSLTNFSVSNIFPEINKGHLPEIYPDPRIKEHSISRSFASTTTQAPTSFHTKPSFSFSTYN